MGTDQTLKSLCRLPCLHHTPISQPGIVPAPYSSFDVVKGFGVCHYINVFHVGDYISDCRVLAVCFLCAQVDSPKLSVPCTASGHPIFNSIGRRPRDLIRPLKSARPSVPAPASAQSGPHHSLRAPSRNSTPVRDVRYPSLLRALAQKRHGAVT